MMDINTCLSKRIFKEEEHESRENEYIYLLYTEWINLGQIKNNVVE